MILARDAVADVLAGCVDGRPSAGPDLQVLVAARHRHRQILDATTRAAVAGSTPATVVVAAIEAVFPTRVLSFVALAMAADAIVLTGRTARVVGDDFGMVEPIAAEDTLRHVQRVLGPHLSPRAVWFRNSVRAGVALALSVLLAKISGIEHAFWVVLATLTVLRSNVATTGTTVVSAMIGTFAGFLLATAATLAIGAHAPLMWVALPLAVFLAGYAPTAISLGAGQAMFALLVVLLFNLMVPEGWHTGAIRVEALTVGALAALAASLIMWPKGASAVLRAEVALHVRAASELTRASFDFLFGTGDAARVESAKLACVSARQRVEEALAAYAGERGQKRVPLAMWMPLVRIPVSIYVADDTLIALRHAGYGADGCPAAAQRVAQTARSVYESFDELADRLDDPRRAPDCTLRALIADLDMVAGAGNRHAEIAETTAACIDASRGDADVLRSSIGLSWATLWLGYLAHLRISTETPVNEVAANADAPWWR
ncbi:MAG: FUSC family protein [Betaproteobacteria bacterium]|nr:MAG: FUSC family protein [Betaproteobacteria bacterium]